MFRNPQDQQNPKLSLEFSFEQDFMEKNGKTYATNEMLGTVYLHSVLMCLWNRVLHREVSGCVKSGWVTDSQKTLTNYSDPPETP